MDTKYTSVLDQIQTLDQRESFINAIDQILDARFLTKANIDEVVEKKTTLFNAKILLGLLTKYKEIYKDSEKFDHFIKDIRSYINELPVIRLQVPIEYQTRDVSELYAWFNTNVKKKVILDIHQNNRLLGGCIVEINGVHKDYSLRSSITHYLSPQK